MKSVPISLVNLEWYFKRCKEIVEFVNSTESNSILYLPIAIVID